MRFTRFVTPIMLAAVFSLNAGAQSDQTEHQRLSDELVQRWEQTAVPQFLEEKKSDISEVMDLGLRIEINQLREILAADQEKVPGKLSELVDPAIYSSLQHQTKYKYLIENLSAGGLKPRSSDVHYSRFGVYLELHLVSSPKPFAWGDVELHFDLTLLDRLDYHINPSWEYGNYNPDSASPAVNLGRASFYIRSVLTAADSQNELVFHGPVSFSYLTKIVVQPGKRAELMKAVKEKKIKCPAAVGWDKLIVEQPVPVKKAS